MRKPLIVANWKMHKTVSETTSFIKEIGGNWSDFLVRADIVLCPPFTSLFAAYRATQGKGVLLGAQNVYFEEKGAFTGEISPDMVKETASYVIIGHSERRRLFDESDEVINRKVKAALAAGLNVILCVGEDLGVNSKDSATIFVGQQVQKALEGITNIRMLNIAYEPIWAIGSGQACHPHQAQEMAKSIRLSLTKNYAKEAKEIRILYGGSVNSANITTYVGQADIDGVLVGGASLSSTGFSELLRAALS